MFFGKSENHKRAHVSGGLIALNLFGMLLLIVSGLFFYKGVKHPGEGYGVRSLIFFLFAFLFVWYTRSKMAERVDDRVDNETEKIRERLSSNLARYKVL